MLLSRVLIASVVVLFCCSQFLSAAASGPGRHFPEASGRKLLPRSWKLVSRQPNKQHSITLNILLQQHNLDLLEKRFWAVSDPSNPDYGQHMSLEEIAQLIAPSSEEIQVVTDWLNSQGIACSLMKSRDWLVAETTLDKVERAFNVKYNIYRHRSGRKSVATLDWYSLPMSLQHLVKEVSGITGLPDFDWIVGPQRGKKLVGPLAITPAQIRARYNVSQDLIVTNETNLHAVSEFQGQYMSPNDLTLFFENYVPQEDVKSKVDKIIGTNQPQNPQLEGSLDIQYMMGVAPNASSWFYTMKSFNFFSDLKAWLGWLNNETTIPQVMSVSYGTQGDYPPPAYQASSDVEYMKLGLRGLSMIYASGDSSAGCFAGKLAPSYPATSVYVTSVGATRFIQGNSGEEAAVVAFGSGGGFAFKTAMPSYQQSAVQAYLSSGVQLPPAGKFNASNRATPDVAALGAEHFLVYNGGSVTPVGGTSASAPTFGAIVTLLNDIRLNNNQGPLGFLNPWLYQVASSNPDAFFDVTKGNNLAPGCYSGGQNGYLCAEGWDPVTGLGTPNFAVLSTLV